MNSSVFTRHHGVLLAESDPDLRKLLHYWLELDGYDVLLAATVTSSRRSSTKGALCTRPFPTCSSPTTPCPCATGSTSSRRCARRTAARRW